MWKVLSPKQMALWELIYGKNCYWDTDGVTLNYDWSPYHASKYTYTIKRTNDEQGYVFENKKNYWGNGYIEGLEFGGSVDWYKEAENLLDQANGFSEAAVASCGNVTISCDKVDTDYTSDDDYIIITGYNLEYDNRIIEIDTNKNNELLEDIYLSNNSDDLYSDENKVEGDTIKITLNQDSSNKNKYAVTIKIKKSSVIPKDIVIGFECEKKVLTATFYELTHSESQSLILGDGKIEKESLRIKFDEMPNLIPPVQVNLNKVDTAGDLVAGAKFKIVYSNGLTSDEATSDKEGKISFKAVQPTSLDTFEAEITETTAPTGYKRNEGTIILQFTFDKVNKKWNICRKTDINLDNGDINGDGVVDSKDAILLSNIVVNNFGDVNEDGKIDDSDVSIFFNNYTIGSEESFIRDLNCDGIIDSNDARSLLLYVENKKKNENLGDVNNDGKVNENDVNSIKNFASYSVGESSNNSITVTAINKSIIEKLTLLKVSSFDSNTKLEGAQFKLTLTNVASIGDYQIPSTDQTQNAPKTIYVTTNENGEIVLEDIEIADLSEDVVITIEETKAPVGFAKMEEKIELTIRRTGTSYTFTKNVITKGDLTEVKGDLNNNGKIDEDDVKILSRYFANYDSENPESNESLNLNVADVNGDGTLTPSDLVLLRRILANMESEVIEENHEIKLEIKNTPVISMGGIVWAEKEKEGKKPVSNNTYDQGDEGVAGVKVYLYKGSEKIATTITSDGTKEVTYIKNNKGETTTKKLAKGEYMFTDVPAEEGYYVVFEYDGIKYQALLNVKEEQYTTTKNSKVNKELNRNAFNTATSTIEGSNSSNESYTNNKKWKIKYNLNGNKAIYSGVYNGDEQQYMQAETFKYGSWSGIFDESGNINEKHYAFNINCGLYEKYFDLNLGTDVASATVKINGQETKYTYDQILDGKLNEALNKSSDSTVDYNLYLAYSDYNYRISDYKVPEDTEKPINNKYDTKTAYSEIKNAKANTELEIYVTYKLVLNNQSSHNATVNLVEYRYDEHYEFLQANNTNIKLVEGTNLENRVLMIDTSDLELGSTGQQTIELTFKVLADGENKCKLNTDYLNQAEIVSYTTDEGGLVDADSAPGNAFLSNEVRYEDDTDEANGIQIKIKDQERSISGKVFDDDKESKDSVNDVIVQLIELVEINNKQYEYIWQETVAGSNTVKTTARNGYTRENYNVSNSSGEYEFTQRIIPGNYIVRFIYGDGTTYDLTDNVKTYNGEDYKSTYVTYNYNAEWYNTETLTGENSKAVDNEARRLKVMSYAVDVDGTLGAKLALLDENITDENKSALKDVLSNTWMCAETLKIKIPVDTDNLANTNASTTAKANNSSSQFANVNFGLMERPQTKLVLEKHITGLTIKPVASGVNLIANATADINDILNAEGDQITLKGQQDGLSALKAGRNNRNMWYLQTDTTELAQGADAYITYTYVVKNEGEEDYLNKDLLEFYNPVKINEYKDKLSNLETEVKNAKKGKSFTNGTYISEFYYTGTKGTNDSEVLASVKEIQEALNPKVKFVDSTTDFNKTNRASEYKYAYYNTNGELQENEKNITEIITSATGTNKLKTTENDTSKKLVVSIGLSASEIENGGVFDSYIAEVTRYTNAAGRRDVSTPANLSYVHSYDANKTLQDYNEGDEFWAETFKITKPTGEDKQAPVQIAIITITSVAVLGIGIILIKKFVLKK